MVTKGQTWFRFDGDVYDPKKPERCKANVTHCFYCPYSDCKYNSVTGKMMKRKERGEYKKQ